MSGTLYGFKMLLRKTGTATAVLSIALLVAIIASTNAIANYIASQTQTLSKLVNPTGTYLILNKNATALTNSRINPELATQLNNTNQLSHVHPQKLLTTNLTTHTGNATAIVRGVNNIRAYLNLRNAIINGTAAENLTEANIGIVLANALSIKTGDEIELTLDTAHIKVKITGIFRSQTQSDAEIIIPIETANKLAGNDNTVSLIEFTIKEDANTQEALNQITQLLPENTKLIQTQQLIEFTQQTNMQTLTFLNVWSIAVYAVVAAASYITATRLTAESNYELTMLRALGTKKTQLFTLVLTYTATTALIGSLLGVALGTAGTQTASTILRWIKPTIDIKPYLEPEQTLQTLLLTLSSSIIGCTYPAFKSTREKYMEQPL